ncbi:MAG TPA: hypothetical protein PK573_14185 [Spirochaetota bacterium]|nr:hypothetical protein [Spirochaetota bacterium]HRZ28515.1 hypothetical protein [Spirochaetota bacterium]HSA15782.1 hypothetical protein [Spirochaetota bacterium]
MMKRFLVILLCVAGLGIFFAGCDDDPKDDSPDYYISFTIDDTDYKYTVDTDGGIGETEIYAEAADSETDRFIQIEVAGTVAGDYIDDNDMTDEVTVTYHLVYSTVYYGEVTASVNITKAGETIEGTFIASMELDAGVAEPTLEITNGKFNVPVVEDGGSGGGGKE